MSSTKADSAVCPKLLCVCAARNMRDFSGKVRVSCSTALRNASSRRHFLCDEGKSVGDLRRCYMLPPRVLVAEAVTVARAESHLLTIQLDCEKVRFGRATVTEEKHCRNFAVHTRPAGECTRNGASTWV